MTTNPYCVYSTEFAIFLHFILGSERHLSTHVDDDANRCYFLFDGDLDYCTRAKRDFFSPDGPRLVMHAGFSTPLEHLDGLSATHAIHQRNGG
jgi:hypothetical protein